jgi:hypothetical protein
MKKLLIVLASTFSAGIAAAQSPAGCATAPTYYTSVVISQATPSRSLVFGSGSTSNGSVINPIPLGNLSNSTVMVLTPTSGAGAPNVAAAMLVSPPSNSAASNGVVSTSSRESAAQITSVVYSADSCRGNTTVRIYGQGFGLVSRPTAVLATMVAVCVTGSDNIATSYTDAACTTASKDITSVVPMIAVTTLQSWSDNLIVLDTAIPYETAITSDIMMGVTNNDTGTQASYCSNYSEAANCGMSFTVNNSN